MTCYITNTFHISQILTCIVEYMSCLDLLDNIDLHCYM